MLKKRKRKKNHRQEIIDEIGEDWIPNNKALLVSYGTRNFGMPVKEAQELADFTIEGMLKDASDLKAKGLEWRMLFQRCL